MVEGSWGGARRGIDGGNSGEGKRARLSKRGAGERHHRTAWVSTAQARRAGAEGGGGRPHRRVLDTPPPPATSGGRRADPGVNALFPPDRAVWQRRLGASSLSRPPLRAPVHAGKDASGSLSTPFRGKDPVDFHTYIIKTSRKWDSNTMEQSRPNTSKVCSFSGSFTPRKVKRVDPKTLGQERNPDDGNGRSNERAVSVRRPSAAARSLRLRSLLALLRLGEPGRQRPCRARRRLTKRISRR